MANIDNFSSVRFLSRHEIGMNEMTVVEKWHKQLGGITRTGARSRRKNLGISDTRHFEVELTRVNKFLKNLPI
jgi:hypothetical protein